MNHPILVTILDALNIVVFEHIEGRTFKLLSSQPDWLSYLLPELNATTDTITLPDGLDYLANFIVDAVAFWQSGASGKLDSDIWSQVNRSGDIYMFEASALKLENTGILLIKTFGSSVTKDQIREQKYKEDMLAFEDLFRTEKDLERYSNLLETQVQSRTSELRERVKELRCLFDISRLIEEKANSLENIFEGTIKIIPNGWQYPEITWARLIIDGTTYATPNWKETSWKQASTIICQGKEIGTLEVCYLDERPQSDEGPFLKEERNLIVAICERLGHVLERSKAETGLKESEERYRALFDRSFELVYIHDFEGNFLDANPAALQLLGYQRDEMDSLNFTSLIDGEQIAQVSAVVAELKETGVQKELTEYKLRKRDGQYVDVETKAAVIYSQVRPPAIQGIARDITERKKAEKEYAESQERLLNAMLSTIEALAMTTEIRDPYTAGHQRNVSKLARAIALELGLSKEQAEGIELASVIHDIGKMYVPADILSKPGKLSDLEFEIIKGHPQAAYDILKSIKFPWPIAVAVLEHHERINGSGYPAGLKGDSICVEAKVIMVADVVEAMTAHRPYRPAKGLAKALEEITQNRGVCYDEEIVDACLRVVDKGFKFA